MMEDGVQGGRARASACTGCNANDLFDLFVASSSRATRRAMEPDVALAAIPMVRLRRRAASREGTDGERARV